MLNFFGARFWLEDVPLSDKIRANRVVREALRGKVCGDCGESDYHQMVFFVPFPNSFTVKMQKLLMPYVMLRTREAIELLQRQAVVCKKCRLSLSRKTKPDKKEKRPPDMQCVKLQEVGRLPDLDDYDRRAQPFWRNRLKGGS